MEIAICTGASSGMGREFVKQLSNQYHYDEIWVIARREDRLNELKENLKDLANIVPMAMDLTDMDSVRKLGEKLEEIKPTVRTLVNASGFGKFGPFEKMSPEDLAGMIDLNAKSLTMVTYTVLPYLNIGSEIYNVDSLSSFQPVPFITVYGATKAYVLSFSRAMNQELKKRQIKVMAVCPGWVKTEFFDRAVKDNTISYYNKYFTPDQVVTRALRDMKKGKDVSVCGASVRNQVRLTKMLPHSLVMKIWNKQQKFHEKGLM